MNPLPPAKPLRQRSPRHPATSLPAALKRAKTLPVAAHEQALTISSALECWGYQPASSIGLQNISALREFGLIENVGQRDRHMIRLTPLALKLLDEGMVAKHAEFCGEWLPCYQNFTVSYGGNSMASSPPTKCSASTWSNGTLPASLIHATSIDF